MQESSGRGLEMARRPEEKRFPMVEESGGGESVSSDLGLNMQRRTEVEMRPKEVRS